jgi:hypothetical protein
MGDGFGVKLLQLECRQCGKVLKASSLGHHLVDVHDIYQQAVVAEELLEICPSVLYMVSEMP